MLKKFLVICSLFLFATPAMAMTEKVSQTEILQDTNYMENYDFEKNWSDQISSTGRISGPTSFYTKSAGSGMIGLDGVLVPGKKYYIQIAGQKTAGTMYITNDILSQYYVTIGSSATTFSTHAEFTATSNAWITLRLGVGSGRATITSFFLRPFIDQFSTSTFSDDFLDFINSQNQLFIWAIGLVIFFLILIWVSKFYD